MQLSFGKQGIYSPYNTTSRPTREGKPFSLQTGDRFTATQAVISSVQATPLRFGAITILYPVSKHLNNTQASQQLGHIQSALRSDNVEDVIAHDDILAALLGEETSGQIYRQLGLEQEDTSSPRDVRRALQFQQTEDEDTGQPAYFVHINDQMLAPRSVINLFAFLIARSFDTTGSSFNFSASNPAYSQITGFLTKLIGERVHERLSLQRQGVFSVELGGTRQDEERRHTVNTIIGQHGHRLSRPQIEENIETLLAPKETDKP